MQIPLTDENFILFAAKIYDSTRLSTQSEFEQDLKRFSYIKRLITHYKDTRELKERLILNHVIILYNCFGPKTTEMLFLKLKGYHEIIKPFILLLNYLPKTITYEGKTLHTSDISMDKEVVHRLRKLA